MGVNENFSFFCDFLYTIKELTKEAVFSKIKTVERRKNSFARGFLCQKSLHTCKDFVLHCPIECATIQS